MDVYSISSIGLLSLDYTFQPHGADPVTSMVLSSNDQVLYTGTFGGEIKAWDLTWQ